MAGAELIAIAKPARRKASKAACLSPAEIRTLVAIAEAAIPAGARFPAGGEPAVARLDAFLATLHGAAQRWFKTMLAAIENGARLRYGSRFSHLSAARRLAFLEWWDRGPYLRRMSLRLLLTPLKVAHFDDAEIFRMLRCPHGGQAPEAADERPRWLERVTSGATIARDEEILADVVVVGTGAGGAVVAKELAERGLAVVVLEDGPLLTRRDFTRKAVDMQRLAYRDMGASLTVGNAAIPIPMGRAVGGTTLINSGTCYRAPDRVLAKWRSELGLRELTPEHLAPYYARVEEILGVATASAAWIGGVGRVIARGCNALGWKHAPLRRNAPDCDGQGVCCFGCPTDAKRSTNVSYVPLALRAGAQLFTDAKVRHVLVEGGRAAGVLARTAGGGRLRVRARAVALACGTLLTPVLLEKNGLCRASGQLGRNLSIHPAVAAFALFDERIEGYNAIPQGYAIEQFHDEGLLFEGGSLPPDIAAGSLASFGPRFVEIMESYDRVAIFGFMIQDRSRGRVRPGPYGRPLITYWLDDGDVARIKRGVELLARVFFAAGARAVLPLVHGFDEFRDERDLERFRAARVRARDFDLSAYHPLGTARIAGDPRLGVCNADHEAWDLPGLYVTDGAAVPTSLAVNPQLTIMALATRAAERIAARLG